MIIASRTGKHGTPSSCRYNAWFSALSPEPYMEAERKNAIAEKLADLAARGRELRRYL